MELPQKKMILECGQYRLELGQSTKIMGILNITPDSFSDGGQFNKVEQAVLRAKEMIKAGADIIDIGGESTRPGHQRISSDEELERIIPVIKELTKEINVPISVDTYKADVAKEALHAGATIINDVWGAKGDEEMARVAADSGAPIILMHNRKQASYDHFLRDVLNDLYESIQIVKDAGVSNDKIVLDPGIGFAKSLEENLLMMRNLDILTSLGYPVLLGTSRKSMIGRTLDLPVEERMEGTGATICLGVQQGCQIIRVHDVKEMSRMARMMDAMLGKVKVNG
ncbi:dihydropteroate synthase [Pradoshia sp. D12]|uniref:dihydropteroate synthase n=1 Tax=Bacillaceae TaxID=186817 RepID=UPI0011DF2C91|nr:MULTISPECIES: dihydropteroate synthase [Bacillaceae]QFK69859.1 dihydropteroate synthase [Pradoshia sp. D12]